MHIVGAKTFLDCLEPFGALGLHLGRDLIVTLGRRRSRTLRVAENVHLRKAAYFSHAACLKEVFFGFAGKADDDVSRKRQLGHGGIQLLDQAQESLGAIGASHFAQHLARTRLQRQMQMAANAAIRCGHELNKVVIDVARLNRRHAETNARHHPKARIGGKFFIDRLHKATQQIGQAHVALAIRAQINAREHDFTHARPRELTHFRNNFFGRPRCGTPARNMHDAVRARIVAAILHLHANARGKFLARANGGQGGRLARLRAKHVGHGAFRHHFDAGIHLGIGNGIDGGGATGYNDASEIVRAQRLAHGLARFLFSLARNGARVHDNEIGGLDGHFSPTARNKGGCEIVAFDAVHLAAKVHDMKRGCIIFGLFQQRHSLHSAINGSNGAQSFQTTSVPEAKAKKPQQQRGT